MPTATRAIAPVLAAAIVGLTGLACSPAQPRLRQTEGATLQRDQDVLRWELLTRPDMLFAFATVITPEPGEGACPRVEPSPVNPALTLFTGNCTDEAGRAWHGEAERWLQAANGRVVQRVRMREYGSGDETITASSWLHGNGGSGTRFSIDVEMAHPDLPGDPQWLAMRYRGAKQGEHWAGRGRVAVDGWGSLSTRTEGLAFDTDRCKSEPTGGKTTLSAARHEVEIEYDGATDCDRPGTAQWRYDGQPRGELSGVSGELGCSPRDSDDPAPAGAWLVLLCVGGLRLSPRPRRPRAAPRSPG